MKKLFKAILSPINMAASIITLLASVAFGLLIGGVELGLKLLTGLLGMIYGILLAIIISPLLLFIYWLFKGVMKDRSKILNNIKELNHA